MADDTNLLDPVADQGTNDPAPNPPADAGADAGQTDAGATDGGAQGGTQEGTGETDWRAEWAGEDKKLLGYLARIPSPKEAVARLKRYEDDFKAGKYLKPLGDDATDEDKAAWKAAMGVPDKAEGYYTALPEGLVVGDEDKPFVDTFLSAMHETGAPPAAVSAALDAYYKIVEDQQADEVQAAQEARAASEEVLRQEWTGGEYKRNINIVQGYLNGLPEGVAAAFKEGRGADGLPLGNNPDVIRWLAAIAMEANPVATVVPGAGANQASAIADEIASIEKMMGNRQSEYWKGPNAAKNQARYLELVDARSKLQSS